MYMYFPRIWTSLSWLNVLPISKYAVPCLKISIHIGLFFQNTKIQGILTKYCPSFSNLAPNSVCWTYLDLHLTLMKSSLIKQLFLITDSRNWTKHIRVVDYEVGYDRKMHEILWLVSSLFSFFSFFLFFHILYSTFFLFLTI